MKKTEKETVKKDHMLLEHYIQRSFTRQVENLDERDIAMAIKTLLQEEKDNKTLH